MTVGNYEAQAELARALRTDSELASLAVGGFHNLVADQDAAFPRVVLSQLNDRWTKYADGEEVEATVNFQISIFTDSRTVIHETAITKAIDRIMKSLEYHKYDSQNLYEEDTKLYHKPLRYEKIFRR